jgi:hypothetical protein
MDVVRKALIEGKESPVDVHVEQGGGRRGSRTHVARWQGFSE